MTKSRIDIVLSYHNELLKKHSETYKISGWGSYDSQRERFKAIIGTAKFSGGTVVDYGCGSGDLYAFLNEEGYQFKYIGLDCNPQMIDIARERHGDHFAVIQIDEVKFDEVDYVFASGIFQFLDKGFGKYHQSLISKLFDRSKMALAVNFLSSLRATKEKSEIEMYFQPTKIVELAASICDFWCIDHSYHPGAGDMTLALHKIQRDVTWSRPE